MEQRCTTMRIEITPHQESIISEAIRSGRYRDAAQVIDDALLVLKTERLGTIPTPTDTRKAVDRLREFGGRHALSLGSGLTIKDLINEGRR
jgi:Arc/MetJ-type ribon-helix-helix transcriptional regulator